MPRHSIPLAERFWAKVDKSADCWIWTASKQQRGYGFFGASGKLRLAHRVAWEITYGPIPAGLIVMHACDNPPCVNPAHLRLGTYKDNTQDAVAKGRIASGLRQGMYTHPESRRFGEQNGAHTKPEKRVKGESHGNAKITESQVIEIRRRAKGETFTKLAADFGFSIAHISRIVNRKSWQHVP